jgi:predicted SnoaL-like aldol condensation-catalyzing enzyme
MKKMLLLVMIGLVVFMSKAVAQVEVKPLSDQQSMLQSSDPKLAQNKKLLYDFWREVFEGGHLELADKYMAETYIQHNPNVATGRQAFIDFFSKFRQPQPVADTIQAPVVAIIAEGDMVMISFARELPDPKDTTKKYSTTWFDMFRIENGKIAEHWDAATKQ